MSKKRPSDTNREAVEPKLAVRVSSGNLEELLQQAKIAAEQSKLSPASQQTPAGSSKASAEEPKTQAQLLFQGQLNPTRKRKIVRLEQWVEVTIRNGVTVTKQVPSNYHMIRKGQQMWPPPEYVYRRINFPNGVPDEYAWTCTHNPRVRQYGGCGLQRMTIDDWLIMIEREQKRADGHIGPTIRGNLPRPPEHGECECPVCTRNRGLWDVVTGSTASSQGKR